MSKRKANQRWEVNIVRETLDEATIYVSGASRDGAWEAADREFMDGGVFDFETIWSEYNFERSQRSERGTRRTPFTGSLTKVRSARSA